MNLALVGMGGWACSRFGRSWPRPTPPSLSLLRAFIRWSDYIYKSWMLITQAEFAALRVGICGSFAWTRLTLCHFGLLNFLSRTPGSGKMAGGCCRERVPYETYGSKTV